MLFEWCVEAKSLFRGDLFIIYIVCMHIVFPTLPLSATASNGSAITDKANYYNPMELLGKSSSQFGQWQCHDKSSIGRRGVEISPNYCCSNKLITFIRRIWSVFM